MTPLSMHSLSSKDETSCGTATEQDQRSADEQVPYTTVGIYGCALVWLQHFAITPPKAEWLWDFYATVLTLLLYFKCENAK